MHWLEPDYLPTTRGTLDRFLLNPHGDIDGLLLTDGTEIHTPPHLSSALARSLKPRGRLEVRGVAVRGADVIVAVAIDPANGRRILDRGPTPGDAREKPHDDGSRWSYEGEIARLLHGPKGNVHGVLLDDGVIVRVPPHAAVELGRLLSVGKSIAVEGRWIDTPHGAVVHAEAIGPRADALKPMPKKPKH
jgi:hypothetical protein